jgi:peptidyl-prolyl cis-trans isomerase B (cyclophilin B)
VDRTLPPFSTRRYVAIWVLGMVPLALVLLVLLRPGAGGGGEVTCVAPSAPGKYFIIATTKGCIAAKLNTDASAGVSKTIANFEQKANAGEFDGRTFHRVEDWVIQGGDPLGTGTGGGNMPSEYNQLPFGAGALGVARGMDTAINNDSQFFITKSEASHLNGQYTNWGQVVEGMEVVNQIAIGDKMTRVRVEERQ